MFILSFLLCYSISYINAFGISIDIAGINVISIRQISMTTMNLIMPLVTVSSGSRPTLAATNRLIPREIGRASCRERVLRLV